MSYFWVYYNFFLKESFIEHSKLIEELNKGNRHAFKHLYTNHYTELCVYASSLANDSSLAEDIVQNVMINIWNKKPNLKINSSIKSYLYKSVYNHFVNTYRQKQKELSYVDQMKAKALTYFADENSDVIEKKIKIVQSEIEKLPPKCKEAFLLNKVNGLKYREVAEELDITVKTVEAHVHKALVRIKKCLVDQKHLLHFLLFYKKII